MTSPDATPARRIALFGGSFNPPHVGHVLNVGYVLSCVDVDEVWVTPTWQHAFGKSLASWDDRLAMLRLALAPFGDRVHISEVERELAGESRTIRVVEHLLAAHPGLEITLVVGSDILSELDRWLEVDRLLKLVRLVVLRRGGHPSDDPRQVGPEIPRVSSTEIRSLLTRGDLAGARGLIPTRVVDFIDEHALYGVHEPRAGRPRVYVVGAGRAGVALGLGVIAAGGQVVGCWSRTRERAEAAAGVFGCSADHGARLPARLPADLDAVLLTVVDDAIGSAARQVVAALGEGGDEVAVLHASGSLGSAPLVEAGVAAALAGSVHPLVALPDVRDAGERRAARAVRDAFVAIEGGARARAVAQQVAEGCGGRAVDVRGDGKVAYHAGAAMVSNFLVTLFAAAHRLLVERAGVEAEQARAMLARLVETTAANLASMPAASALTGPVRRGDVSTIQSHLRELSSQDLESVLTLYRALLPPTIALAARAGLSAARVEALGSLAAAEHGAEK